MTLRSGNMVKPSRYLLSILLVWLMQFLTVSGSFAGTGTRRGHGRSRHFCRSKLPLVRGEPNDQYSWCRLSQKGHDDDDDDSGGSLTGGQAEPSTKATSSSVSGFNPFAARSSYLKSERNTSPSLSSLPWLSQPSSQPSSAQVMQGTKRVISLRQLRMQELMQQVLPLAEMGQHGQVRAVLEQHVDFLLEPLLTPENDDHEGLDDPNSIFGALAAGDSQAERLATFQRVMGQRCAAAKNESVRSILTIWKDLVMAHAPRLPPPTRSPA